MDRLVWTPAEVVDVDGPRAMLRAYLEQRDARELLGSVRSPRDRTGRSACDVGCGFGRMTPVLTEFASAVVGFEREAGLLATARRLQPNTEFKSIERLRSLPAGDSSFDLGLVFTVVQHVPDDEARAVLNEVKRILKPSAALLVCEETDESLEAGDPSRAELGYTRGRSVDTYAQWLTPWRLLATRRRVIEPGYDRDDVGQYMLFVGNDGV